MSTRPAARAARAAPEHGQLVALGVDLEEGQVVDPVLFEVPIDGRHLDLDRRRPPVVDAGEDLRVEARVGGAGAVAGHLVVEELDLARRVAHAQVDGGDVKICDGFAELLEAARVRLEGPDPRLRAGLPQPDRELADVRADVEDFDPPQRAEAPDEALLARHHHHLAGIADPQAADGEVQQPLVPTVEPPPPKDADVEVRDNPQRQRSRGVADRPPGVAAARPRAHWTPPARPIINRRGSPQIVSRSSGPISNSAPARKRIEAAT